MPVLAYLVTGGAEDAAHPNEDPVQQSQALAFSKYAAERPQRPKPAMLRRTSSRDEVVGCMLGAREERRSWDTLPPQYASRAGSRRVQQNMEEQEKDENEEEADYAEGVGRSVTSNSAHLIDSGDEESLFENLETGDLGRYAGPPSYMLVAMRDCRSKDAAASAVSLCLAGVLYGVKATWAEQIMNRAGVRLPSLPLSFIEEPLLTFGDSIFAARILHSHHREHLPRHLSSGGPDRHLHATTRFSPSSPEGRHNRRRPR